MNSFGTIFRVHIFGESHGPSVGITLDGCPAGIPLSAADFVHDIERRKGGTQLGTTPRKEDDIPIFLSGVFNDTTTGAPLTIIFENNNTRSNDYTKQRTTPRPGHADFTASIKMGGFEDYRGGGHFSGRLTVCLVAAGVIAKKILALKNIHCSAILKEVGGEADIEKGIANAVALGDSVGGIVECVTTNVPVGLGEPFFNSAESLISHAVFAIPAIKGIEFGSGFAAAKMYGSTHNDAIQNKEGVTLTNHAAGIVGGITNGNEIIFRVAVKPTSSTPKVQQTYDNQADTVVPFSVKGRHDLCIALRVPVVLEAVTSMVLVDLLMLEQQVGRVIK
ncbi:chorismate synthase [Ferruginibacter yonginensis]|uniref:Chorismate synthase n=1 Tax=Ferruginibacter yonginensis TaxID=1310416 RepID=A0ABV8QND2_9BACT